MLQAPPATAIALAALLAVSLSGARPAVAAEGGATPDVAAGRCSTAPATCAERAASGSAPPECAPYTPPAELHEDALALISLCRQAQALMPQGKLPEGCGPWLDPSPPGLPDGEGRLAVLSIEGDADPERVRDWLERVGAPVGCYEEGLYAEPGLAGALEVRLEADGEAGRCQEPMGPAGPRSPCACAQTAQIVDGTILEPHVRACASRALEGVGLPVGVEAVTIRIEFSPARVTPDE